MLVTSKQTDADADVMPVDLDGFTAQERVAVGRNVESLLRHPGFDDLCKVLDLHGEGVLATVLYRKPCDEPAVYADVMGHMRGLREVGPIARGIVEDGKEAERELREAEERG